MLPALKQVSSQRDKQWATSHQARQPEKAKSYDFTTKTQSSYNHYRIDSSTRNVKINKTVSLENIREILAATFSIEALLQKNQAQINKLLIHAIKMSQSLGWRAPVKPVIYKAIYQLN